VALLRRVDLIPGAQSSIMCAPAQSSSVCAPASSMCSSVCAPASTHCWIVLLGAQLMIVLPVCVCVFQKRPNIFFKRDLIYILSSNRLVHRVDLIPP